MPSGRMPALSREAGVFSFSPLPCVLPRSSPSIRAAAPHRSPALCNRLHRCSLTAGAGFNNGDNNASLELSPEEAITPVGNLPALPGGCIGLLLKQHSPFAKAQQVKTENCGCVTLSLQEVKFVTGAYIHCPFFVGPLL